MDKEQIERRSQVTSRQIKRLEGALADAPKQKSLMHPKVYRTMVAGIESVKEELQEETREYKEMLKNYKN